MSEIKVYNWKAVQNMDFDRKSFLSADSNFIGTLVFKIWGDKPSKPCIYCYFITDDGGKLKLTAYWNSKTTFYSPRNNNVDFKEVALKTKWENIVELNSKGNPTWKSAIES